MRIIISLLLATITISCHAEKPKKCDFTSQNIKLITPNAENIANSFWQKDVDGYEVIDRLYVNYKNGSVAVIEHKYCSMYNFEVAYYSKDKSEFSDTTNLEKTLKGLFSTVAISDKKTQSSITTMISRLEEKKFNSNHPAATAYDDSTEDLKRAEYSISYTPIEDSSLHKAALFVYMGIGGEH